MSKDPIGKELVVLAVSAVLVLWLSNRVDACSCDLEMTVEEWVTGTDAVFLGEVEFVSQPIATWDSFLFERRVNFRVIEAWKGVTGTQLGVTTGMGWGDCGVWVTVGDQILVYGSDSVSGLGMSVCGVVGVPSEMEAMQAELEQLGYEPLTLTEGADSQWPPYATGACGLGVLPTLMMTVLGLACLRTVSSGLR